LHIADLTTALLAGLLGSLHCIGMCGPLAAAGCRAGFYRNELSGPLMFVTGKFVSYSILGLLAGTLGAVLIGTGVFGEATAVVSLAGGIAMLAVIVLSRAKRASGTAGISIALGKFAMRAGVRAPLFLGAAAALLPCGLLYAMVVRSAASGGPVVGMALMQAFGIGTTPALVGLGAVFKFIPQKWSRFGNAAGETILVLMGIILIWRGIAGLLAHDAGPACCP
jgi:hypothetical protein